MLDLRKIDVSKANLDHERSRIRYAKRGDQDEMKRLWEIERDRVVALFVEELAVDDGEMATFLSVNKDYLVVAVEGKLGHVEPNEVGKLQGWISVYHDDKRRLNRLTRVGLVRVSPVARVLEIGFAKHPLAKAGQMASAIRQLIKCLFEEHRQAGVELVVTAYAGVENEASRRVLDAAGFKSLGQVKYRLRNRTEDHFYAIGDNL